MYIYIYIENLYIPVIIYDQQACDAFCSSIEVALVQLRFF